MKFPTKIVTLLMLLISLAAGSMTAEAQQPMDLAMSIPRTATVEAVNSASRIVRLDDGDYRLVDDPARIEDLAATLGTPLSLSQLRPGMEVIVVTDAIGEGRDEPALLFGLWRPR